MLARAHRTLHHRIDDFQMRRIERQSDMQFASRRRNVRGKSLVERIPKSRRYRVRRPGIRTLAGLLVLRDKVLKPVLAGIYRPKRGRPPKNVHPLDLHYQNLRCEMLATLQTLKLVA